MLEGEDHLSGYLEKKGVIGFYTKKWATLEGSVFSVFKDEDAIEPEVQVLIRENTKIEMDSNEPGKFSVSFEPETKEGDQKEQPKSGQDDQSSELFFKAPSQEDCLEWVQALRSLTYSHSSISNDSFKVICVLGRGNYGKVVLAEKKDTGKVYAIKSIHKKRLAQSRKIHTIISERNTLVSASNPFIVKLYYAYQTATKFYLVLQYVPGGELFTHMDKVGALPLEEARLYAAEIVIALHYIHSLGIIYRDLKPENILLDADGHIMLTDFGFAKDLSQTEVTKTFCGTNEYLAPEIISRISYGQAVDWWTLGILIYEMLFQTTPFYHNNTSRMFTRILTEPVLFPPGADPDVCSLIVGLLQKKERRRFTYDDIVKHPFFAKLDWNKVMARGYTPMYKPPVKSMKDVSNFDQEFTNEAPSDSFGSPVGTPMQHIPDFSYSVNSMLPPDISSQVKQSLNDLIKTPPTDLMGSPPLLGSPDSKRFDSNKMGEMQDPFIGSPADSSDNIGSPGELIDPDDLI